MYLIIGVLLAVFGTANQNTCIRRGHFAFDSDTRKFHSNPGASPGCAVVLASCEPKGVQCYHGLSRSDVA